MEDLKLVYKKVHIGHNFSLSYRTVGEGKHLVFLHGWGYPWKIEPDFISSLAKQYELIFLDLPGYGQSSWEGIKGTVFEYAQTLAKFLAKLGIANEAILIGHSMGSVVILNYLVDHPKFGNRILFCGLPLGEKMPLWVKLLLFLRLQKLISKFHKLSQMAVDYISRETQKIGGKKPKRKTYEGSVEPEILINNALSVLESKNLKTYKSVAAKPVLIYGEKERFKKFCDRRKLPCYIIKEAGHSPMTEKPRETAELILKILKKD